MYKRTRDYKAPLPDDPGLLRQEVGRRAGCVAQEPILVEGQALVPVSDASIDGISNGREPDSLGQIGTLGEEELLVERGLAFTRRSSTAREETWTFTIVLVPPAIDTGQLLA